ncbi:hypothetical protein, partial [Leclercia adecarboxylata]|uniref:hypothetical protein n=1 Tax=Leclercia adecarboxylata TaxID=83655 RepID=UPI00234DDC50
VGHGEISLLAMEGRPRRSYRGWLGVVRLRGEALGVAEGSVAVKTAPMGSVRFGSGEPRE